MTDNNPFVVDQEEFSKSGLTEEAYYLWRVDSVKGTTKEYEFEGEKVSYPVIQMKLVATHTVEADEEGNVTGEVELDNPITRSFEEFKISGRGARKLRTLYQAITGRPVKGVDGKSVDLLSSAEELLGGSAWNNIFHVQYEDKEGNKGYKDMLTNTFKSKAPKRIRVEKVEDNDNDV